MNLSPVALCYTNPRHIPKIVDQDKLSTVIYNHFREFSSVALWLGKNQATALEYRTFKVIVLQSSVGLNYWENEFIVIAERLDGSEAAAVAFYSPCTKRFNVIKRNSEITWAEFCLRAIRGAAEPINKKHTHHLYEVSKNDGVLLTEVGSDFSCSMNAPQPNILRNGLVFSVGVDDSTLFNILCRNQKAVAQGGLDALVKAAAIGRLDRVCDLILRGVSHESDNYAKELAAKNKHWRVVEFFNLLERLA